MVNVLIPIFRPYYQETGLAIHVQHVVQTLADAGWQVDVLLYSEEGDVALPGARTMALFSGHRWGPRLTARSLPARGFFNLLVFFRATGLCWTRKYDALHMLGESAFLGALLKRVFRTKLVYDMNASVREALRRPGLHVFKSFWLRLERFLIRSADLVVSPCGSLTDLVQVECPGARIVQLDPPPLFPAFREDSEGAQRLRKRFELGAGRVVVCAGNYSGCQGVETLLKAARLAVKAQPDLRFIVMGVDHRKIKWLGSLARSLDIGSKVVFLPRQPLVELPAFYSLASLLVSVRSQGLLLPVELPTAMQSGKPLVAIRHPIHTQLLTEQEAFLVMPNPDDIAAGWLEALTNSAEAGERAARARTRVAAHHSLASFRHRLRMRYLEMFDPHA